MEGLLAIFWQHLKWATESLGQPSLVGCAYHLLMQLWLT